jgi:hypothetical protein
MMEQPKPDQEEKPPNKCPFVDQDPSSGYLVCKASNYGKKGPTDDSQDYRPIGRDEIVLCCSLSYLDCPDYKKGKKLEARLKSKEAPK